MENQKTEEFSSFQLMVLIVRHRVFVLSITALATVAAVVISFFFLDNEYKSTVNVVPPQSQDGLQGSLAAISSTLKDIGLSKLAGKGASENYSFIVILMSRSVLDSLIREFDLIKIYKAKNNSINEARLLLEENLEISYEKDGNYFISIWDKDPKRSAAMANRIIEIANDVAIRVYREEVRLNMENMETRIHSTDSVINAIADTLERFSKRTLLYSPTDQAGAISKALSDLKSEEIKYDIIYEYYKNLYGENDYMTQSVQSIKNETRKKLVESQNKPGFAGNFAISDAAEEGIEFMRLYTEFETYSKVRAFILPMMEQTKLDETKKIRNLIVVDPATPAEKKDRPKRSLIIVSTIIGTFILAIFIIVIVYSYRNAREKLAKLNNG